MVYMAELFGNFRGRGRIWGCEPVYTGSHPQIRVSTTANPNEPIAVCSVISRMMLDIYKIAFGQAHRRLIIVQFILIDFH